MLWPYHYGVIFLTMWIFQTMYLLHVTQIYAKAPAEKHSVGISVSGGQSQKGRSDNSDFTLPNKLYYWWPKSTVETDKASFSLNLQGFTSSSLTKHRRED